MNEVAIKENKAMLRPLKVLVSLIKEDIANGDAAAQRAGMPYYRAAGEKLLEAKEQVPYGEWQNWMEQNFSLSYTTAHRYMKLAANYSRANYLPPQTLTEVHQRSGDSNHKPKWYAPAKNVLEGISHDEYKAQIQKKSDEKILRQKMALELIDAGFKMMAIKLHPDKGGSDEAMRRLTEVHQELREMIEQQIKAYKKLLQGVDRAPKN